MLLLWIVFDLLDFGSSYKTKGLCYGSSFNVIPPFFTTSVYYEPRGGERTLAVSPEGESNHKRFSVTYGSIKMKDVTEQDHGAMLFFGKGDKVGVKLEIHECQDRHYSLYGDKFSWKVPSRAEYLEFSQKSFPGFAHKPQVIWNRTDASSGWGAVKHNSFQLLNLKQKHSGYYKFMGAEGELVEWKRLEVEDRLHTFEAMEGDDFHFNFPVKFPLTHVHFHPLCDGSVFEVINQDHYDRRTELTSDRFHIRDLKRDDSGTYEFIDDEGFLAVQVYLVVRIVLTPPWAYIVIILVFIVLCIVLCYICVKKYSCKKCSSKRNRPESAAAASRLDTSRHSQPVMPLLSIKPRVLTTDPPDTSRHSRPVMPLLSIEPRVLTTDPPTYDQAVGNTDLPPSTQDTSRHSRPVMPLLSIEPRVLTTDPPTYDQAVGYTDLPPSTQATGGWGPTSTTTSYDHISQLRLRP